MWRTGWNFILKGIKNIFRKFATYPLSEFYWISLTYANLQHKSDTLLCSIKALHVMCSMINTQNITYACCNNLLCVMELMSWVFLGVSGNINMIIPQCDYKVLRNLVLHCQIHKTIFGGRSRKFIGINLSDRITNPHGLGRCSHFMSSKTNFT